MKNFCLHETLQLESESNANAQEKLQLTDISHALMINETRKSDTRKQILACELNMLNVVRLDEQLALCNATRRFCRVQI